MYSTIEIFQIGNDQAVLFKFNAMQGCVGEHHYWTDAYVVNTSENPSTEKIFYTDVKNLYKNITGKKERMSYWAAMRSMSPEAIEEESMRAQSEAISNVV